MMGSSVCLSVCVRVCMCAGLGGGGGRKGAAEGFLCNFFNLGNLPQKQCFPFSHAFFLYFKGAH